MTNIYPLIICGGNGTRLWPVSRTHSPKQFNRVGEMGSLTFFQTAVKRHWEQGYEPPIIVSSMKHRKTVHQQMDEIGVHGTIIHEPMGRNTGPAVLAAAHVLSKTDPNGLLVVVPADHVIEGDLNSTIMAMKPAAEAGHIITFGIKPRYAETGFGYITDGGPIIDQPGLRQVERFVEKPPTRKARLLVESDIAYWASGLSMFSAKTIIEEYSRFDPDTVEAVRQAVEHGEQRDDGLLLSGIRFGEAAAEPTESMVFEKTDKIALAPLDVDWSDVGSWTAMYGISQSDAQGNVLQGDVIAVETKNSMVRSANRLVTVVGLENVIVIDTEDALLVTRVGHDQSVKKVATHLKDHKRVEAEMSAEQQREKTSVSEIVASDKVKMSTARVVAGEALDHRSEAACEIIMVNGAARVESGDEARSLREGERLVVSAGEDHKILNRSDDTIEFMILEIETAAQDDDTVLSLANYG